MKRILLLLLCGILSLLMCLSSCQLIPSMGGTESETESETEAETVPTFTGKNTVFVLYERAEAGAKASVLLTGEVCLAGMEGVVKLPLGATVIDLVAGEGVSVAFEGNEIRFALLSQNGENITEETVLFTYATEWTTLSPTVTVADAFDENLADAAWTVEFYAFGKNGE
jgi:hypothetical protein